MSEEEPIQDKLIDETKPAKRPSSRSAFAPILLISAGVFFLLNNLGVVADLDWSAALRFWPLLLIFIGLNILVVQLRPPLGTALSVLVSLAAVAVFGYLLLAGPPEQAMRSLGLPAPRELSEESFAVPLAGVESAEITLDLGNYATDITAREGDFLVTGTIWSRAGLDMEQSIEDGRAEVTIGEQSSGFSFDPGNWANEGNSWEFFLNPDVPTDLRIDSSNGVATADLSDLTLSNLTLDASNGSMTAALPDGDYDIRLDGGNGQLAITLPAMGAREMRVDGGNGQINLLLPAGVAARVEYDEGGGAVEVDDRFERISGDSDEGVYETAGYDGAADRMLLVVDSGNGSVSIVAP